MSNIESGERMFSYDGTEQNLSIGQAVDPTTGNVYGITYNAAGDGLQLGKIIYGEASASVEAISPLDGRWSAFAIDKTGIFYGIKNDIVKQGDSYSVINSRLCTIDRTSGEVTEIGPTGIDSQYITGAVIDQKTNRMFWSVSAADNSGCLYEVNLQTGAALLLYHYMDNAEYTGLYIPDVPDDGAPGMCENVVIDFPGGGMTGHVVLDSPATTYDGNPGTGTITIHVLANGIEVGSIASGYGVEVSVPISLGEAGLYDFTVYASNSLGDGPKTNIKQYWIGTDTPSATTASLKYENGNMVVTWLPVESTINGGYLDVDNLTYTVTRADGSIAAEGLTVTTWSESVAEPSEMKSYYYTVTAVTGDLMSSEARTNTITLGSVTPPYTSDFDTNKLDGWTVIDANTDGITWAAVGNEARVSYNYAQDMDDWLISVPLKMEAGKSYVVKFYARANGGNYPERLEVKYGRDNTVAGMTDMLLEPTVISGGNPTNFSLLLTPDENGLYYIGFHGISDANQYFLYLGNVTVEAGISGNAPAGVTDLVVTPDAQGGYKALVSFKAPDKSKDGAELENLSEITVLRDGTSVKTFENPLPGSSLTYEDELAESGNVTYTVIPYNSYGVGIEVSASTFVGYSTPQSVTELNIGLTEQQGEVVLNWKPVTKDVNGLSYTDGIVKYNIYKIEDGLRYKIASDVAATTYSYQAVEVGKQKFVQCCVYPIANGAEGNGTVSAMIPVGTPYAGISESFAEGKTHYIWGLTSIGGGSASIISTAGGYPSYDNDGYALNFKGTYEGTGASISSGLVSLDRMMNPVLSFHVLDVASYSGISNPDEADTNEIVVCVMKNGEDDYTELYRNTVAEICSGSDDNWGKVNVNLSDYINDVIRFRITGLTMEYQNTIIDDIRLNTMLDYNLAAMSISSPQRVLTGSEFEIYVEVVNNGEKNIDSYDVELYLDNRLVDTIHEDMINSGVSRRVIFRQDMPAIACEPMEYYAKVVCAEDENSADDITSSVTVTPEISILPRVENLSGLSYNGNIKLTWSEPDLESGFSKYVTFDFEDADSFTDAYGDFIFIDGDKVAVGGFQGMTLPGIVAGSTLGSFWVWDQSLELGNSNFDAHSGQHYLFSLFRYDNGRSDEWAITPELDGSGQEITFYAKSLSAEYPEQIELYYSTGGTDTEDFIKIDGVGGNVPDQWTLYKVNVPEGAARFAIRSCADNSYMLMIDDMSMRIGYSSSSFSLEGYNVYRDNIRINDELVGENEYVDENVEIDKAYVYVVTAVYTGKGESAASNEVTVQLSGVVGIDNGDVLVYADGRIINIDNAEGLTATVTTTDGVTIFCDECGIKTHVDVDSGIYIVTVDGKSYKLIVR